MNRSIVQGFFRQHCLVWGMVFFLSLLLGGCARNVPVTHWKNPPAEPRPIDKRIQEAFQKHDLAGLSIAVVKDGEILWSAGYGYSNVKQKTLVTPDTPFRAGRLSSLVTVAAAKHLVETTDVSLEDSITDLLPETTLHSPFEAEPRITLAQVLRHRAGLPSNSWDYDEKEENAEALFRPLPSTLHGIFPSDSVTFYSHLGMNLVAKLLQVRSGKNLEEYSQEILFTPLEMTNSSFLHIGKKPGRTRYYVEGDLQGRWESGDPPSMGLKSSATDFAKFVAQAMKPGADGGPSVVDLAGVCRNWKEDPRCAMLAADGVSSGAIALVPEHQLAAVVFSNTRRKDATMVHLAWRALVEEAKKGGFSLPSPIACDKEPAPLPEKAFDGFLFVSIGLTKLDTHDDRITATYEWANKPTMMMQFAFGLVDTLTPERNAVSSCLMPFRLFPCTGTSCFTLDSCPPLFPQETTSQTRLVWNSSANPSFLEASLEGAVGLFGLRVTPSELTEHWAELIGDYRLENSGPKNKEILHLVQAPSGFLSFIPYYENMYFLFPALLSIIPQSDRHAVVTTQHNDSNQLELGWVELDTTNPESPVLVIDGSRYRRVEEPANGKQP